jgi:KAP family P-loop domain
MWSDNDTTEDLIGFRVHAELIRDVVGDDTVLPVTIGVFGDWGSGKTSIMKMLQAELTKNDQVAVVYFDAWLFEGYDDAKSALISSILKQLMENKRFPAELKDKATKLIKRVNWMRLMKMGWDNVALPAVLAYATGGATAVPAVVTGLKALFGKTEENPLKSEEAEKVLKEPEENEITEVKDFRDKFDELLRDSKFKSLVVLIDDLDRCSPDRIVENLEAIRLFLNVDKTAFIIGADPRIVRHGIAVRYHQALDAARTSPAFGENPTEAAEQLVRDYVEKLIQVPYHLPRLSPAEIETYLSLLFAKRDLSAEDFKVCLADCEKLRAANRFGPFGLSDIQEALGSKPLPPVLKEALSFTAGAAHLITENLKGNPRQVKRFLNAFVLRRKLAKVAKMDTMRDDVLLKLMLLEYSNETRFRELARWHEEQDETPKQIHDMETDKQWPKEWGEKDSLRRWVGMEPKLSPLDLSEYFWLVRDRLASSQIGLSLTPPAVKASYDALLSESGRKNVGGLLKGLREAEVDALTNLLSKALQRDSKNTEAYNAFLKVAETIPSTMDVFGTLIKNLPSDNLPGWLSGKLELLSKHNAALKGPVDEAVAYLKTLTTSRAGKAAQQPRKA